MQRYTHVSQQRAGKFPPNLYRPEPALAAPPPAPSPPPPIPEAKREKRKRSLLDNMLVPIRLEALLNDTAAEFGVTPAMLRSARRSLPLPIIRAEFCRRAWAMDCYSAPEIGRAINRSHTNVLYLIGRIKNKQPSARVRGA